MRQKKRAPQDVRFSKKTISTVDRGARYKVYAIANTSQLFLPHRWHPAATCRSPLSACTQHEHLGESAARAEERCTSPLRYLIEHGTSLTQHRSAWVPAKAWPSVAPLCDLICRRFGRMYLWTPSVYSDAHAVLTGRGPCARRVRRDSSKRRWKRSKRASVRGTCVRSVVRAFRGAKKASVAPVTRHSHDHRGHMVYVYTFIYIPMLTQPWGMPVRPS